MNHGDIYWIHIRPPMGSEPGFTRPCVIVQSDSFNRSSIKTTVVCTITTNLRLARAPGNVLLDPGEADLPQQSVVLVSQLFTVNRFSIEEFIGTLSGERMLQIIQGINTVIQAPHGPVRTEA